MARRDRYLVAADLDDYILEDGSRSFTGDVLIDGSGASDAKRLGIFNSIGGIELRQQATTVASIFQLDSSGNTEDEWIRFTRNGGLEFFHNDAVALATRSDGIRVQDPSGNDPLLYFYDDAGSPLSRIQHANDTLFITNEVHGKELRLRTEDSAGTTQNHIRMGRNATGSALAFHGNSPVARQTVTGSRGGNAALTSLLTALNTIGLITNSST